MRAGRYLFLLVWLLGCQSEYEKMVPVPALMSPEFTSPEARPLPASLLSAVEGVYAVGDGTDLFGGQVALKWTYQAQGRDTTHYLSVFTGQEAIFLVLEGRRAGNALLFEGYWRKLLNTDTGTARFTVPADRGGSRLLAGLPITAQAPIILQGTYGYGADQPGFGVTLTYQRPVSTKPFQILAHRGGGRTSDLLPASENSVEMIRLASRLGATGVEIDVRLTKDGVPVLYHDAQLNLRLLKKSGLVGSVSDYTYPQLATMVQLMHGERIPTLTDALETVLNQTPLQLVWLDTKFEGSMEKVRDIQQTYRQKAAAMGRTLDILIGLPDEQSVRMYEQLADPAAPALCELDIETVRRINARVWAPRWTLGRQNEAVQAAQAEGRRVFTWTLDDPVYIEQYMTQGRFDGILSNYPSVLAYYHYTGQ
ncbi:hypothetical protein GCM10023189_20170 [Nibrella saemangeumensis]|uniref:GP-PDE domain-containing protein n=1 Tax=Nibrella saemangeumensis TaxID=1084526 RepID=A0ABP8MS66_9BACT